MSVMIRNRIENYPSYMISNTFNSLHASPQGLLQPSEEERNDSYISTEYTGRTEEPDQSIDTASNDSGLITSNTYLYLENEDVNEDTSRNFFQEHSRPENVSVALPPEKEPSIKGLEEKKEERIESKIENKEEETIVKVLPLQEPLEVVSKSVEVENNEVNNETPTPAKINQYVLREKSDALLSALPVYDSHGSLHIAKEIVKRDTKNIKKNQPLSHQATKSKKLSVSRLRKLPAIQFGMSSPKVNGGRRYSQNLGERATKSRYLQHSHLETFSKNLDHETKVWNNDATSPTRMNNNVLREKSSALLSALHVYDSHSALHMAKDIGKRDTKKINKNQPLIKEKPKDHKSVNRLRKLPTIQSGPSSPKVDCGRRFSQNLGEHISKSKQLQNSYLFPIWNVKESGSKKVIKTIGDLIKSSQNTRLSTKSNLRALKKNFIPSNM